MLRLSSYLHAKIDSEVLKGKLGHRKLHMVAHSQRDDTTDPTKLAKLAREYMITA
jgi:hypothetical protein